jgi:hypothetical protein
MRSSRNHNVGVPNLKFVLVVTVTGLIVAVALFKVGLTPHVETITPFAGLQAAPTRMALPTAPVAAQDNNSWFPPRSDLESGLAQASRDGTGSIPSDGMLGTPPSGAQMPNEPPSFTGRLGIEPRNSATVLGTPPSGVQMPSEPPSVSGKMDTQLPRSEKMLGIAISPGMSGPRKP